MTIQKQEEQKCSSCFLCGSRTAGGERRDAIAKFLTYEDRMEIQNGLKEHMTFTQIGEKLERDRAAITKELRNYSVEQDISYSVYPHNNCKYRKIRKRKKVCGTDDCKHPLAIICKQCELLCNCYCEQFEAEVCTHRFKPPYACNGCSEVKKCTLTRAIYDGDGSAEESIRKDLGI